MCTFAGIGDSASILVKVKIAVGRGSACIRTLPGAPASSRLCVPGPIAYAFTDSPPISRMKSGAPRRGHSPNAPGGSWKNQTASGKRRERAVIGEGFPAPKTEAAPPFWKRNGQNCAMSGEWGATSPALEVSSSASGGDKSRARRRPNRRRGRVACTRRKSRLTRRILSD
jgi:hypothetical protein